MITLGVTLHVLDGERVVFPTRIEPLNGFALFPFPFGELDDGLALLLGVLATVGTLKSAQFAALLDRFANGIEVITQPCPGLVECVERGELDTHATRALVARYVAPLLARGADTIVLGCTHYPFLQPLIAELAGPQVALIETGPAVARQLERRLKEDGLAVERARLGSSAFYASGDLSLANRVMRRLWAEDASIEALLPE